MLQVILTIHVIIVAALVGIVLLQRSEGGALGIGGGGGGLMSGRGAANSLTRGTALLAALFFATSMGLAIFADRGPTVDEQIEALTGEKAGDGLNLVPGEVDADDLLGSFGVDASDTAETTPDADTTEDDTSPPDASETPGGTFEETGEAEESHSQEAPEILNETPNEAPPNETP